MEMKVLLLKVIIILMPFLLLSCKSIPQKNMEAIQLASVYVYLDFKEKGYTTVGASPSILYNNSNLHFNTYPHNYNWLSIDRQ